MIRHTDAHREAEEQLARRIESAWGWTLHRQPELTPFDYIATSPGGRTVALVELKCLSRAPGEQAGVLLDQHKDATLLAFARRYRCMPILVVSFGDGSAVWTQTNGVLSMSGQLMGRSDRGDDHDREPAIRLPAEMFRPLP